METLKLDLQDGRGPVEVTVLKQDAARLRAFVKWAFEQVDAREEEEDAE